MQIILSPQFRPDRLSVSKAGDVLTINEYTLDFAPLLEGATLPAGATGCPWIKGPVTRTGGVVQMTMVLPHGPYAPYETRFPEPITVTEDGPIALPDYEVTA